MIFSDYFKLHGKYYLIIGDRLSGWTEVLHVHHGGETSGSKGLCAALRRVFATFGVPREISSDGGPEFIASATLDFLDRWGSRHRLSSAYNPQSNGRAEVAVKATKRLLEKNIGPDGNLNSDQVVRALLQVRNTPDRDCKLSPAEILFGRRLRDATPQLDKNLMMFANPVIDRRWHNIWVAKELAIADRAAAQATRTGTSPRDHEPLREGDSVFIQNQDPSSSNPKKWDRQGQVVACGQFEQNLVRVFGSGRLTLRNRRFLRKAPPTLSQDFSQKLGRTSTQHIAANPPSTETTEGVTDSVNDHVPDSPEESLPINNESPDQTQPPIPCEPQTQIDSDIPPATGSADPVPVRRSTRVRKETQFYDADTGSAAPANDGGALEGEG